MGLNDKLREKLLKKTKKQVKEKYSTKDIHIIRAISSLYSLDESFNMLAEHIKEWYGIHFPELESSIKDNEIYLKLIVECGFKEHYSKAKLKKFVNEKTELDILKKAEQSIGADITDYDLLRIQGLSEKALSLKIERERLIKYIDSLMSEELPSFTLLAGPLIGAKLLSLAGNKKKLALMSAGTIQLLGAEKALFRHLKVHSKPPKYGVIFSHPMVMKLKKKYKGRMARTLATKLSLAAKEDYFKKGKANKKLLKELEKRFNKLIKLK